MLYAIAYDVGTTGLKTCLFRIDKTIQLVAQAYCDYGLYVLENGGAEQDTEEWWHAITSTTKQVMASSDVSPEDIRGISFCAQMQGMVLVDKEGKALRRPMSYMDQRASREMKETEQHGLTISGVNAVMLLKSLRRTTAASTSVKDPLWKYKWVQNNEPDVYSRIYKWLDVKEYLICRMTDECVMTRDSAYSTFLYDSREGRQCWSEELCRMYGVNIDHLPRIIECTDVAGVLSEKAAGELGLVPGINVYGSGGDATLIGVGAGSVSNGDTHIYWGTSGWVSTVIDHQAVDIISMIAGIVGAQPGLYNYFAEMETAGKCFEWVKDHLVLDEIKAYLGDSMITESKENQYTSLYEYMSEVISNVAPGAGGVIFTPWLHGNRCPFEAPDAAGMFFNIRLETGKSEMLRAVIEGVCYHLRWMLECEDKKIKTSDTIRFVGGGALSPVTCQILADITGRRIETVKLTKDIGSVGAAMLIAVGSGELKSLQETANLVPAEKTFEPNPDNSEVYDMTYKVFKELYKSNKKNFEILNKLG